MIQPPLFEITLTISIKNQRTIINVYWSVSPLVDLLIVLVLNNFLLTHYERNLYPYDKKAQNVSYL